MSDVAFGMLCLGVGLGFYAIGRVLIDIRSHLRERGDHIEINRRLDELIKRLDRIESNLCFTSALGIDDASVANLIAAEPWQKIVGPPVKNATGGWLVPSEHVSAIWPHEEIPDVHSIYIKREFGGYRVAGIYDVHGKVHQR